ncbi:unnamed protein product, partial [Rotaria magnacalcarata]
MWNYDKLSPSLFNHDKVLNIFSHHFNSTVRRVTSHVDDLGYDSGYGERNKWDPYNDNVSSSDTDSDL